MKTELTARLRELERLNASGAVSDEDYALALRERRGAVLSGRRIVKRGRSSVAYKERAGVISKVRSVASMQPSIKSHEHSVSVRMRFAPRVERAPEVVERDMRIKYDREMVKAGRTSVLVRIVKRSKVLTATLGELAEVSG